MSTGEAYKPKDRATILAELQVTSPGITYGGGGTSFAAGVRARRDNIPPPAKVNKPDVVQTPPLEAAPEAFMQSDLRGNGTGGFDRGGFDRDDGGNNSGGATGSGASGDQGRRGGSQGGPGSGSSGGRGPHG